MYKALDTRFGTYAVEKQCMEASKDVRIKI
jgi:hypothetical protein